MRVGELRPGRYSRRETRKRREQPDPESDRDHAGRGEHRRPNESPDGSLDHPDSTTSVWTTRPAQTGEFGGAADCRCIQFRRFRCQMVCSICWKSRWLIARPVVEISLIWRDRAIGDLPDEREIGGSSPSAPTGRITKPRSVLRDRAGFSLVPCIESYESYRCGVWGPDTAMS